MHTKFKEQGVEILSPYSSVLAEWFLQILNCYAHK